MKRLTLPLLLSSALHICVIIVWYTWMEEPPTPKNEPIVIHMRTFTVHQEDQKKLMGLINEPIMQASTLPKVSEQKSHSKKRETSATSVSKSQPFSTTRQNDLSESNASLTLSDDAVLHPSIALSTLEPMSPPSYVELHGNAIKQAIEKEKMYPELARKRLVSGIVEMSFTITPQGDLEEVKASSSSKILSTSAIETVHKAKVHFPLPMENVTIKIPIAYILK